MQFEFATATRIIFGGGKLREAGAIVRSFGRRPLVVTGSDPRRAEPLLNLLRAEGVDPCVFSVRGEPSVHSIADGTRVAREFEADHVIGFGGGSALDAGKAIAIMAANAGNLFDYLEVIGAGKPFAQPSLPYLAIPTTAGTGSEVTRNAVLGSPEHRAKASLRSPWMLPRVALIDPELTLDLPLSISATSGLDALTQLIEPFVSGRANPPTDALCREAIPRVARVLPSLGKELRQASVRTGTNEPLKQAREDMALASLFGGLALANAGLGAVHGFANPIGGMFAAPHGAICAALLPHVMEANLEVAERHSVAATLARYEEVARLLTGNLEARAVDGVEWVRNLVQTLPIPPLSAHGIGESDLDEIVARAQKASSMKGNPVPLTDAELRAILERSLNASRGGGKGK